MLQQLCGVLKPLREHVPAVETVAAKALHHTVAVPPVNSGAVMRYSITYIFNMSIGSGSTRLSRLDDVSDSGSFRSSNAVRGISGMVNKRNQGC